MRRSLQNQSTFRRKKTRLPRIILLLAIAGAAYFLIPAKESPENLLLQAKALSNQSQHEELGKLLRDIPSGSPISPWLRTLLGSSLLKLGRTAEAISEFDKVLRTSAAWPEAQLGKLQAKLELQQFDGLGLSIAELETALEGGGRKDLLPELTLLRAEYARKAADPHLARDLYQGLRNRFPSSAQAGLARVRVKTLIDSNKDAFVEDSPAQLYQEVTILIKEKLFDAALAKAHKLKDVVHADSSAFHEALLLEEKILRKLRRNLEADRILLLVSADGTLGSADEALLKIAKNYWNVNEHQKALEFLESLQKRFPTSPLVPEANYIRGRVYEELRQLSEAKAAYSSALKNISEEDLETSVRKRLAWIQFETGNLKEARIHLLHTAENSKSEEARIQSMFWHSYFEGKPESFLANPNLSAKNLGLTSVYYTRLANELQSRKLKLPAKLKTSDHPECSFGIQTDLIARLLAFTNPELRELRKYEIYWNLYLLRSTGMDEDKVLLSLVKHLEENEFYKESISHAERLFRRLKNTPAEPAKTSCLSELTKHRFPTPYLNVFQRVAEKTGLPASLLLAITRTESHFDKDAESHREAKGLMQLLDSTATSLGMNVETQSLFHPELNIELGAKYLAAQIKDFEGQKPLAIAAYNAGPTAVKRWRSRHPERLIHHWIESISYPETQSYVKKVLASEFIYSQLLEQEQSDE